MVTIYARYLADFEVVMLSCKVQKFNKYNWVQERALIITQDNIYNFKIKKVKRVIKIEKLAGLTKSLHKSSKEFVIHVLGEYDYRLKSD
jgi:Unconventional myosin tail, actin- and lipid-binding